MTRQVRSDSPVLLVNLLHFFLPHFGSSSLRFDSSSMPLRIIFKSRFSQIRNRFRIINKLIWSGIRTRVPGHHNNNGISLTTYPLHHGASVSYFNCVQITIVKNKIIPSVRHFSLVSLSEPTRREQWKTSAYQHHDLVHCSCLFHLVAAAQSFQHFHGPLSRDRLIIPFPSATWILPTLAVLKLQFMLRQCWSLNCQSLNLVSRSYILTPAHSPAFMLRHSPAIA